MHRVTARTLLLLAFLGNLAPIALAASAASPHACCRRMAGHHCHDAESPRPAVSDRSCCSRDVHRALTLCQSAHARPWATISLIFEGRDRAFQITLVSPPAEFFTSNSTRAPPQASL